MKFTQSKIRARRQRENTQFTRQAAARERENEVFLLEVKSLIDKFTVYQCIIFFLEVLTLASAFFYGFGMNALIPVLIAIITTTIFDFAINYFKYKTIEFPQSALISGLFIGGLLTQGLQWYVYAIAGTIAIASKHLIKINQKHIFNPANLGILLASIIFGAAHTWWISSPLILVLIFGIFIIWRLRRFDLALSFLISYYLINSAIELVKGSSFNDVYSTIINGGVIYFFSMFMLIEPKTNPSKNRVYYGILAAILLVVFSQYPSFYRNSLGDFFTKHSIPLALAIGNVFVPLFSKMNFEFKKKEKNPETGL